jgi:hypothetical protein
MGFGFGFGQHLAMLLQYYPTSSCHRHDGQGLDWWWITAELMINDRMIVALKLIGATACSTLHRQGRDTIGDRSRLNTR